MCLHWFCGNPIKGFNVLPRFSYDEKNVLHRCKLLLTLALQFFYVNEQIPFAMYFKLYLYLIYYTHSQWLPIRLMSYSVQLFEYSASNDYLNNP